MARQKLAWWHGCGMTFLLLALSLAPLLLASHPSCDNGLSSRILCPRSSRFAATLGRSSSLGRGRLRGGGDILDEMLDLDRDIEAVDDGLHRVVGSDDDEDEEDDAVDVKDDEEEDVEEGGGDTLLDLVEAEQIVPHLEGMGLRIKIKKGEDPGDKEVIRRAALRLNDDLNQYIDNMPRDEKLRRYREMRDTEKLESLAGNYTDQRTVDEFLLAIDNRWDKVPAIQREAARQERMAARRRLYGYRWTDEEDKELAAKLQLLAEVTGGGANITVPSVVSSVQEAIEFAMETDQNVIVEPGRQYTWEPETLAILPNSTIKLASSHPGKTLIRGGWEFLEDAQGGLAGTNFSTAGEQDETSTMIFRGAQVVMQQCDVRCVGGSCLRLHNGRSMELELDRECGMTYLDWDDNSDEETGTVRGMTRPDIPSYVNMLQCGLGGDDPRVEDFVANLDDDVCRAQSCIDLFDDCAAELQRCTMTGCDTAVSRGFDTSILSLDHCYAAFCRHGFYALEYATLNITNSCVEFMWLGSGVRLQDMSTCEMRRCDIRECSYGISIGGSASLNSEFCILINNTYCAYNMLPIGENEPVELAPNVMCKSNQVHVYGGAEEWLGGRRPKKLKVLGQNDIFDHSKSFEDLLESQGLGRNAENVPDEVLRRVYDRYGMSLSDIESRNRELDRRVESGELDRELRELSEIMAYEESLKALDEARAEWDAMA